ncbi:MAG TPA: tyrosine-type recombinase/integrase [Terracidiphilus sp.]|nr:tyrosine-type recombinase/integrase [Terracidiphilus sp.]
MTDSKIARLVWKPKAFVLKAEAGLQLTVYPRGMKTWQLRCVNPQTGKPMMTVLGHWPATSYNRARKAARSVRASLERGDDLKKLPARISVSAFATRWIEEVVIKARKDPSAVVRVMRRDVTSHLGHKRLAAVTAEDVRRLVFAKRDAGRPEAAAALRHLLKRLFDYALAVGIVDRNPVAGVPLKYVTQHKSRSRSLSHAELVQFFRQLPKLGFRYAAALELVLLTLCRKGELLGVRWKHIDFEAKTCEVPAEMSKTGLPHIVYLSDRALEILRIWASMGKSGTSENPKAGMDPDWFVFPHQSSRTQPMPATSLNKAMGRIDWGLPHFTVHDLRRTAATLLSEKGYDPDWIEKALNHSIKGIRGVYNRAQYAEQRKRMLQEWAEWLGGLKIGR